MSLHLLTTPNGSGKLSTIYCTANLLHPYLPLPQVSHALAPRCSVTDSFASLFTDKISKLRLSLASNPPTTHPHLPSPSATVTPPVFYTFTPASESEIHKILSNCPNKQSDSDPIPTWLLKECASVLIPTVTNIVNLSLTSGQFHPIPKNLLFLHSSRNPP